MSVAVGGERLCVALDLPSYEQNLRVVDTYGGFAEWFKVGDEQIFHDELKITANMLRMAGKLAFCDAKLSRPDGILESTIGRIAKMGFHSVSLSVGDSSQRSLVSAVEAAGDMEVWVVALLTSLQVDEVISVCGREYDEMLFVRTEDVLEAGADGIICSGIDLQLILQRYPEILEKRIVMPGIVPSWYSFYPHRHKRFCTPSEALTELAGLDSNPLLVVGSALTSHHTTDQIGRVERILEEINSVL